MPLETSHHAEVRAARIGARDGAGPGGAPGPVSGALDLFLFATRPTLVGAADRAGVDGFIVDWERRGKERRQRGEDTQVNHDTLADLRGVRAATRRTVLCRLNGFGRWTRREVDLAVEAGADEVLLPMVRSVAEVDRTLDLAAGRCGVGILIETRHGVDLAAELGIRPLSRVYVGLNDLRIDRGSDNLFEPLVDGTVDEVRRHVPGPFGVAGLTLPDRGDPVPSRLLAAELSRSHADFTFLRRSFLADTGGVDLELAVTAIRHQLATMGRRDPAQVGADRRALAAVVLPSTSLPA